MHIWPSTAYDARFLAVQNSDLRHNDIETLPDELGTLDELQVLNVAENMMIHLPELKNKKLKHLDVSLNQLESLPKSLKDLTNLETVFVLHSTTGTKGNQNDCSH